MSTQVNAPLFRKAAGNVLSFCDADLFKKTDNFRGYPNLVGYDLLSDPDFQNIIKPKIDECIETLHAFDNECAEVCEADEIRYKFAPHSNDLAGEITDYLIAKGCTGKAAGLIGQAMKLHDIGKEKIDAVLWHQKEKVNKDDVKEKRRCHTIEGEKIVRKWLNDVPADNIALREFIDFAADLALYHHVGMEPNKLWDKVVTDLPIALIVAATVEGYDGHRLERDTTLPKYRTPQKAMDKMEQKCDEDKAYHPAYAYDYCQYRLETPSPIPEIRNAHPDFTYTPVTNKQKSLALN